MSLKGASTLDKNDGNEGVEPNYLSKTGISTTGPVYLSYRIHRLHLPKSVLVMTLNHLQ